MIKPYTTNHRRPDRARHSRAQRGIAVVSGRALGYVRNDVYNWWAEKYGRSLQAFWPVVDTEIGRLGIMMANEGSRPRMRAHWR